METREPCPFRRVSSLTAALQDLEAERANTAMRQMKNIQSFEVNHPDLNFSQLMNYKNLDNKKIKTACLMEIA